MFLVDVEVVEVLVVEVLLVAMLLFCLDITMHCVLLYAVPMFVSL